MIKINDTRVPIYSWAVDIEESALQQARDIANYMPVHDHLAIMADAHMGMGMPIGGVMPLVDAISPNAVGSDIGCGMYAVRTNMKEMGLGHHEQIRELIKENIPMGFNKHERRDESRFFNEAPIHIPVIYAELDNARKQLGTLGGGNHFIEIQKGSDGFIWFMIHSGSRHIGKKICDTFNDIAKSKGNDDLKDLSYFHVDSDEAQEYAQAMGFALRYAYENRRQMARIIMSAFRMVCGLKMYFEEEINIHHNFASFEVINGVEVVTHRKGATLATENTIGIIPGSQGTPSYIVRGRGNPDSFYSCSHGAGRTMSRTKATGLNRKGKRKHEAAISIDAANEAMGGLVCNYTERNVDEAPQAYKDIRKVMAAQADLVEILVELTPYQIAALKG